MKNKYNAKKTVYNGHTYDSKKEAAYTAKLDMLMKATGKDKVLNWERQIRYDIIVEGQKIGFYKLDFKVEYMDKIEYIDVKGFQKGCAYRMFILKKKLVEALFNIKILEK